MMGLCNKKTKEEQIIAYKRLIVFYIVLISLWAAAEIYSLVVGRHAHAADASTFAIICSGMTLTIAKMKKLTQEEEN